MEESAKKHGTQSEEELFDSLPKLRQQLVEEIGRRIVGQSEVIDQMLVALFSGGHCLFVGVPGLAKTLLVNTVSEALGLRFGRVQFTPDLLPADITGGEILHEDRTTGQRELRFAKGPIFVNLLLADEINRTPPKTQAALLESMQEKSVTAGGQSHPLEPPFLVFATQNPIEQEGTYPLPEAQLDRFMFSIHVGYPSEDEEVEIISRTTLGTLPAIGEVFSREKLLACQALLRKIPISVDVNRYAARLARASRPDGAAMDFIREYVHWGAGPRASQYLSIGARVRAGLHGRDAAHFDDVDAVAESVLRHRIVRNFRAEAEGVSAEAIVSHLIQGVHRP
jgi:MoxR-like ATPase